MGPGAFLETQRPLKRGDGSSGPTHGSGHSVNLLEHQSKMMSTAIRGGAQGLPPHTPFSLEKPPKSLEAVARELLEESGGDAVAAPGAAVKRENALRRELGGVRDASAQARVQAPL